MHGRRHKHTHIHDFPEPKLSRPVSPLEWFSFNALTFSSLCSSSTSARLSGACQRTYILISSRLLRCDNPVERCPVSALTFSSFCSCGSSAHLGGGLSVYLHTQHHVLAACQPACVERRQRSGIIILARPVSPLVGSPASAPAFRTCSRGPSAR